MGFYKPPFLNQWLAIYKSEGFKVLLKRKVGQLSLQLFSFI